MSALAEPSARPRRERRVARPPQTIGSVLPMPPFGLPRGDSLWSEWTATYRHVSAYGSARSALAALLEFRGIQRVWLPAYACPALLQAAAVCEVQWYGVDATLTADTAQLATGLRRGDAVLAIDYFGRSSGSVFGALAASRPDVLWIEDRAQALRPGFGRWADVVLFSPRKLVGVGEGGILVANSALPVPNGPHIARSAQAQFARAADLDGALPDSWYPAFRAQEAAFGIDDSPMEEQTRHILGSIAAAPAAAARSANARALSSQLADLALWPTAPWDFAPLAFPIRVQNCAALAASLAAGGIFCARHWPDLPSDPAQFPEAHRLAADLLSLPCDQRYSPMDMLRIVDALRARRARPA